MTDDPIARLTLELDPAREDGGIAGWVRREGRDPERFEGWLELLTLLRDLNERARPR